MVDWGKIATTLKDKGSKLGAGLKSAAGKAKTWGSGAFSKLGGAGTKGYATGAALAGAGIATGAAMYSSAKARGVQAVAGISGAFSAYNVLLIVTLIWHFFVDIPTDFGLFYQRTMFFFIVVAPIAWVWIYGSESGVSGLRTPFIVSFIAIIVPVILLNRWVYGIIPTPTLIRYILFLAPIWPIFIMFSLPKTRFTQLVSLAYIMILLVIFLPMIIFSLSTDLDLQTMQVGMMGTMYDFGEKALEGAKMAGKAALELPSTIRKGAEKQIQYATGDYYTGQVEKGKNEPIGVYLENLEPSDPEFTTGQSVIVWATLKARTLDPDKEITVRASCYGEAGKGTKVQGDADPTDKSSDIYTMKTKTEEEKDITCEFKPNSFEKGMRQIFVDADFNFITMSYIKAYFMDLERLRAMKQENIDPLTQYGITEKKPVAVFTNGPVALNMETIADQPIGVSTETPREVKLGITIENRWTGKIKSINDITVKIPPGLDVVYCDHAFEKVECEDQECEDGKYTYVYRFTQEGSEGRRGLADLKDITSYQSFVCRLQLESKDALLGTLPLATQYFKATADYVYQLEKATAVNIKELEGGEPGAAGAGGTAKPPTFEYSPVSAQVSVKKGLQKAFSVKITNPGTLSYGWKVTGVKEDISPQKTSYIFMSDVPGSAKVIFSVFDEKGNVKEERIWDVTVTE